jgi:predicted ATPase/DNA-binding transcriptional regulator YiaG
MAETQERAAGRLAQAERPYWSQVLRALREARGVTREAWADFLGYGLSTVQRWEGGEAVPDAAAEAALVALCQERGLFRHYERGLLQGLTVTPAWLSDLLAEARLGNGRRPAASPGGGPPGRPTNLPTPLTRLIGREQEVAEVAGLLEQARLVTLTGAGGSGKTRLALAVAAQLVPRFAGGVCFVDLSLATVPDEVAPAIARVLDLREAEGRPLSALLQEFLRTRRVLLVLDNFEQVLGAAALVRELLAGCAELHLLLTSRVVLRLPGEREYAVQPLPLPPPSAGTAELAANPAVALFVARAQEVRPDFALSDANAASIAAIVQRLEGLPLAIELAAARLRALPLAALLARLDQRLPLLTGGSSAVAARQQTLRATLQWSYDLLSTAEQAYCRRLAVFAGGCTLDAAAAVCDPAGELGLSTLDGLEALLAHSLLRQREGPDGEPRYDMLGLIREFGLEQLEAAGEAEEVAARHAAYFAQRAEAIWQASVVRRSSAGLAAAEAEQENLRAMLGWYLQHGDADVGLRAAAHLVPWFTFRSPVEGRRWLEQLLARPGAQQPSLARAWALDALGWLVDSLGYRNLARQRCDEAAALAQTLGDRQRLAYALMGQARTAEPGDPRGIAYAEAALNLFRELDDEAAIPYALTTLGIAASKAGQLDVATAAFGEAVAAERAWAGENPNVATLEANLGWLAAAQGNWEAAASRYRAAISIGRTAPQSDLARQLISLGLALCALAEPDQAAAALREGLTLAEETQYAVYQIFAAWVVGRVAALRGDDERAVRLYAAAASLRDPEEFFDYLVPGTLGALVQDWREEPRAALGEEAYAAAWAAGQALSLDDATALALAVLAEAEPLNPAASE